MKRDTDFWAGVVGAWRNAANALYNMPVLFLTSIVAKCLLYVAAIHLLPRSVLSYQAGFTFFAITSNAIHWLWTAISAALVSAPIAVAVFRFLLLSQANDRPVWIWRAEVPFIFFLAVFLDFIFSLSAIYRPARRHPASFEDMLIYGVALPAVNILAIYLVCRLALMPAATALEPDHANWGRCWSSSKGHFWDIFGTILFVSLPSFIVLILIERFDVYYLLSSIVFVIEVFFISSSASILYSKYYRPAGVLCKS